MQEIRIGQTLDAAADEASAAAAEARERLAESTEAAMNRVADVTASTLRQVGQKGAELGKQMLETQDQWVAEARECVRQHPLTSVAVAVAIGMLVRRLLAD